MFALSSLPHTDSLFHRVKQTEIDVPVIDADAGLPFLRAAMPADAAHAAGVRARLLLVPAVGLVRHVSQIAPAVIRSVAVDVINLAGLVSGHQLPDHAMRKRHAAAQLTAKVSVLAGNEGGLAASSPCQGARLRIVNEELAQVILRGEWTRDAHCGFPPLGSV